MITKGYEPIPGYRCEVLLGRGQFGEVWRATAPGRTSIALKFLDLRASSGWKEFRGVQRVKAIRHPNLMPIISIWLLDEEGRVLRDDELDDYHIEPLKGDDPAAAMQETLVAGPPSVAQPASMIIATPLADKTLGDRKRECQEEGDPGIPRDELLGYMDEAAKGLDFLNSFVHEHDERRVGVQHGDVKPDNFMLMGGSVVVSDFGVSQIVSDSHLDATATSICGSPVYMSPESFEKKPSKASDQYALAITYYELRTGKAPFRADTLADVLKAHQTGSFDFSASTDAEQKALQRATSRDASRRFESCEQFVKQLRGAPAESVAPQPQAAPNRSGSLAAVAGLAAVAALVGYFVAFRPPSDPAPVTTRVTFVVDPPDAELTVNGERRSTSPEGRTEVEVPLGAELLAKAELGRDYAPGQLRVPASDLVEGAEFVIRLDPMAEFLARRADEALARGDRSDAVDWYSRAVEVDGARYSQTPSPTVVDAGGEVNQLVASGDAGVVTVNLLGETLLWSIEPEGPNIESRPLHDHGGQVMRLVAAGRWVATLSYPDLDDNWSVFTTRVDGPTHQIAIEGGSMVDLAIADGGRLCAAQQTDPASGSVVEAYRWELDAADALASRRSVLKAPGRMTAFATSRQGRWTAVATEVDRSGELYLVESERDEPGEVLGPFAQSSEIVAIDVSPDAARLAYGGSGASRAGEADNNQATLLDLAGDAQDSHLLPWGHDVALSRVLFDSRGAVATAGLDGDLQYWADPLGAEAPKFLQRNESFVKGRPAVVSVVCLREPGWLAAAYEDGVLVLWDANQARPSLMKVFATGGPRLTGLAVTADGRWLVVSVGERLLFWSLPQLKLIKAACEKAGVEPKPHEPESDRVTAFPATPRPLLPRRRSLLGSFGTAFPGSARPTACAA